MDFGIFDADNHYYEAEDAFLRHADEKVRKHVRWLSEGKRRYLVFGDRMPSAIANPTFNPVTKPGVMHEQLVKLERGERPAPGPATAEVPAAGMGEMGGGFRKNLEPISPAYRDRDFRLMTMDQQGVERNFLFPTLGQSCETMVSDDPDMLYRCFRAFNDWVDDDWGFARDGRIYAPPVVPMMDVDRAVVELDRVIEKGARVLCLRSGPVYGRSPADPYFDPFWARIDEARVVVLFHAIAGPTPYPAGFDAMWNKPAADRAHMDTIRDTVFPFERPVMDTLTAMVLGNMFGRFPNLRVASIEMGGAWVPYLMHSLDKAGFIAERQVTAFGVPLADRPSDIMREHVWVSPFPEEDISELVAALGVGHVLMGSDWPHGEGMPQPADYELCLDGFDDAAKRRIMRENALALVS